MQTAEETIESRSLSRSNLSDYLAGALITAAVTLFFLLLFWNRFAGLRSGNGSFQGGMALLRGILPYRDYFTAGPPFEQVLCAGLLRVFGEKLIVIRGWGVFEHAAMAVVLYCWLARLVALRYAALASILAVIVSTGDPSSAIATYGFDAISFFVLSGWFVSFAAERGRSINWLLWWSAAAGFFAALSLATKQTLGAGATVGIPFLALVFIGRTQNWRRALTALIAFAIGWGVCIGAMLLWLHRIGVVEAFLQDVFQKGPSAKASHPTDFLVRAAHALWGVHWGFAGAVLALSLSLRALRDAPSATRDETGGRQRWLGIAILSALPIALGAVISYAGKWPLQSFASFTVIFAFAGVILLLAWYARRLWQGRLTTAEWQMGFLAGIAFGIASMVWLSWPLSYDMTFPAFAVVTAAALTGAGPRLRMAIYAVCALVLFALTCEKLNRPQGFHEWSDPPVRLANTRSSLPELQGMLLPASSVDFIDSTVRIIQQHSHPDETIFVYPEFGILYTLSNRLYPTATDSHNIDVVNDEFARKEAQRLLAARPAVVVYYQIPAWSLKADEKLWRNGRRSGQRDLIAAVEQLTGSYQLAASFRLPPNETPVRVYVRH